MEDDLDANIIKATQLSLGKYVKRPPLSDKLLKKPPFRFLHDIVTSVLKSKGFFEGLFEENELISDNVKDRESKILFLNKVISVVSLTTGKSLSVKSSKIVAGQEPTRTNELLQCLALALDENLSSDEAVKQFRAGLKISSSNEKKSKESVNVKPMKNIDSKKLTVKSSEKFVTDEKDGQTQNKSKIKESNAQRKESPPKKTLSKVLKKPEKTNQDGKKNPVITDQKNIKSVKQKSVSDNVPKDTQKLKTIARESENTGAPNVKSDSSEKLLQPAIRSQEDLLNFTTTVLEIQETLGENESISKPKSANTTTTNDQPDEFEINNINDKFLINSNGKTNEEEIKIELEDTKHQSTLNAEDNCASETLNEKTEEQSRLPVANSSDKKDIKSQNVIRPSSVRPSSSRPGAPRLRDKSDNIISDTENIVLGKVNIISENAVHEEEEDTSIIIEDPLTDDFNGQLGNKEHNNLSNQSHLVQQILDSQKEFSQISSRTEIEWQFGTQKSPNVYIQEMENLRFSVQALSRIANPLGKLMDHIQEDVEVMRQELQQWTKLNEETSKDLLKQKAANVESLLPFHSKLKQLTTEIEDRHEKLADLKISVHKNAIRIEKLLANGIAQ